MSVQEALFARVSSRDVARLAMLLFGGTLFFSAYLLFWIEPLFARMLLPRLGGAQAVWNTCLVFFQASLLIGYSYAHLSARFLGLRIQVMVHILVLGIGCWFLPLTISAGWIPPADGSPVMAVFLLLLLTLGWPFVALSANAPLLQHWFACSGITRARNPFHLYAVSNAGSLLSLLAYPFLIEPGFTLTNQARLWAYGYVALTAVVAFGGLFAVSTGVDNSATVTESAQPAHTTGRKQKVTWLIYAALPASLLIGVTSYVTTDIASFPFLWICPLCLYLLSFVLSFAARPPLSHARMVEVLPIAIVLAGLGFWVASISLPAGIAIQFAAFFVVAIVCHGELARTKPPASELTEFYLWLSLGGVIGGALTALGSPLLFKDFVEYPLALGLVCLLRPDSSQTQTGAVPRLVAAIAIIIVVVQPLSTWHPALSAAATVVALAGVALIAFRARAHSPLMLPLVVFLAALHAERIAFGQHGQVIWKDRSFYGVYTVTEDQSAGYRIMFHGPTLHGVERLPPAKYEPLTYYAAKGPLGDIMRVVSGRSRDIGAIGMGIGSTGCYARKGQSWTFYELDGLVDNIARESGLFHSMSACVPKAEIVLGDGRLNLARDDAAHYDLLVLDAFSSDAIPVHLLTREAFQTYSRALKRRGVIAIHITNRHFDLAPVIARAAAEAGLVAYERKYLPPEGTDAALVAPSRWMVLARSPADLGALVSNRNWTRRTPDPLTKLWTDDYSNVLAALK